MIVAVTFGLVFFGSFSAFLGSFSMIVGGSRVLVGGWTAMAITYGVGRLLGAQPA
jgi:VIT1/CCC1 family predicted Fe2+/Mn2+ transporter